MADLSVGSGSGTQNKTQSPQGSVSSGNNTEAGSNVQPGTATSLLTSPTGVTLHASQLSTVSLNSTAPASSSSSSSSIAVVPAKHHLNSGLLGLSIGLFIIAGIVFWIVTQSAKNTTHYN